MHPVIRNGPHRVQHVHFLVANLVGVEGHHRFHGHQAEQLHQVILHHVAQGAGPIVIAAAMFHAHFFGDGDGHVVHITPVPDRLEQRIGKAERQDVLHRLFAQIMVDAEDLGFLKTRGEGAVQRQRRIQVVPDRFLARRCARVPVGRQAGAREEGRDFAKQGGRRGHVENALGFGAPLLFQAWRTGRRVPYRSHCL
jgi:hypothetical protein